MEVQYVRLRRQRYKTWELIRWRVTLIWLFTYNRARLSVLRLFVSSREELSLQLFKERAEVALTLLC